MPNKTEPSLAGISSETHPGVPGLRKAVNDPDQLKNPGEKTGLPNEVDPLLKKSEQPLEGPDRTDLTEFYSDDVLEEDPTLTDRTEQTEPPEEEKLTIHDRQDRDVSPND